MARRFEGKVALVTGGSSGIGRATAVALAREGAKVVIGSRGVTGSEETVALIRKEGGEAAFVQTDVSRSADIERLVSATVQRYGRLDLAVNNAGVTGEARPLFEISEEEWDQVVATNQKAVWLGMKHQVRQMLAHGGGAIVNVASMAGLLGIRNLAAYVSSKHGVVGLTRAAALELATQGIRVNVVCPTVIRGTAMIEALFTHQPQMARALEATHPMGRAGRAEEVAAAILWLLSEEAAFVTGHAMPVDGGTFAGR